MKKSIYSLTLIDELVREIDKRAYLSGNTRSGLINKILAEYVGFSTPEERRLSVFSEMERLLSGDDNFLINEITDSLFAVRSSLRFKYNPTVKYSVVIYPEAGTFFGELRASLRTQNALLLTEFGSFFSLWQKLEDYYFEHRLSEISGGKFTRRLVTNTNAQSERHLADLAARYIKLIHEAMSAYFGLLPDREAAGQAVSLIYAKHIENPDARI